MNASPNSATRGIALPSFSNSASGPRGACTKSGVVLLLLATRPEAAAAYNSPAGVVLIVSGLLVSVIAYRVMIRLGRMPEERRWFA